MSMPLSSRTDPEPAALGSELSWPLLAAATFLSAPYGAAIGIWSGSELAAYAALKLPLVLLLTAGLTTCVSWVIARALGWRVSLPAVARLILMPLAIAALILASLAPIGALFSLSAPAPSEAARTTHNLLYLTHTLLIGAASLTGCLGLWRQVRELVARRGRAFTVVSLWVAVYAAVGGEVAWTLRPFVGSVYDEVAFVRQDALDGNVYEFIVEDIFPHLASRDGEQGGEP